jgi:hypothetical protein
MTIIFAAISGQILFHAVIGIIIAAVIWWLVNWLIGYIGLPEPFNKVLRVIVAIVAVIFLINFLFGLIGQPFIQW